MKKAIVLLGMLFIINTIKAQEFESILLAKDDATKLTKAYIDPALKGLVYSMNNGWYHTAKVHKKLGFDISINVNAANIPEKEEIFNLTTLGLSSNTTYDNNTSPTVFGDNPNSPTIATYQTTVNGQNVSADFELPGGIKEDLPLSAVPGAAVQIGVGLPFKIEAMIRYLPELGSDDVKGGLWGIGLKKEITDWFGPLDKTPLHVSLLAAYSSTHVDYIIGDVNGDVSTRNALTEFRLNTYTVQAIASLNFPIINIYGGIGYNGGSTNLDMLGTYTLTYETGDPTNPTIEETITDPLSLTNNAGSFSTTVGARLSLGFFKIYGSYTLQEFSTLNAGIAFSFR